MIRAAEEPRDAVYRLVEGRHGRFLCNPNDRYVGRSLIAYGEWGEAEVRLFERVLRSGDVAVEVGSNIGSHTAPIYKAVGPGGTVHAFEPQRLVHQLLCANLALNDCFNVHAHRAAVGDTVTWARICDVPPQHEFNYGALAVDLDLGGDSSMDDVPLTTIDDMGLERIDFIKVDAEGLDLQVLEGAKLSLAAHRPALFVEAEARTGQALFEFLRANGYNGYWYCSQLFDADNFNAAAENIWRDLGYTLISLDVFAVPREAGWEIAGLPPMEDWAGFDAGHAPISADNFRTGLHVVRPPTG